MKNVSVLLFLTLLWSAATVRGAEELNRGVVALERGRGQVFVSWRLLQADPSDVAFNLYRRDILADSLVRVNKKPITDCTCWLDSAVTVGALYRYHVRPVTGGKEGAASESFFVRAFPQRRPFVRIMLQGGYDFHNVAVADLDGDGAYDYVIKQPDFNTDPWHEPGYWQRSPGTFKLEAYSSAGKFLWRYDMGWAIEMGSWYSPFVVYDIDGDGRAEMYAKAGEDDPREIDGEVISGPEYLVKVDGLSGQVLSRIPWFDRKGFDTLSPQTRNFLAVAYLDGKIPVLIMQRGTYGIIKTGAFDGDLKPIWYWEADGKDKKFQGQGQHGLTAADIDGDGRDELVLGSAVLDDNGAALWTTGLGHPDVGYVADIDPGRPGLEIFYGIEPPRKSNGVCLVEAKTGKILWGFDGPTRHVHEQGMLSDIDASHPGMECYAGESDRSQFWLYSAAGERLSDKPFGDNDLAPHAVWWDADPQKEIVSGDKLFRFDGDTLQTLEGRVVGIADVLGDWREELIVSLPGELRIYSTDIPAVTRRVCLMQDRQYRTSVAAASMGYFYPPQLGGNRLP